MTLFRRAPCWTLAHINVALNTTRIVCLFVVCNFATLQVLLLMDQFQKHWAWHRHADSTREEKLSAGWRLTPFVFRWTKSSVLRATGQFSSWRQLRSSLVVVNQCEDSPGPEPHATSHSCLFPYIFFDHLRSTSLLISTPVLSHAEEIQPSGGM